VGTHGLFASAVDATPEVNRSAPTAGTGDDQFQDDYLPLDGGDFFDPMEMDVEKNRSVPTGEGAQEVRLQLACLYFKDLEACEWHALSSICTNGVPNLWKST
jgi:hypothetical protein